jgi:hypothetical protein
MLLRRCRIARAPDNSLLNIYVTADLMHPPAGFVKEGEFVADRARA